MPARRAIVDSQRDHPLAQRCNCLVNSIIALARAAARHTQPIIDTFAR
jgi:hypothetical protein